MYTTEHSSRAHGSQRAQRTRVRKVFRTGRIQVQTPPGDRRRHTMEPTVSGPFPSLAGIDVDAFPDCPFLGSRYTPVSDASRCVLIDDRAPTSTPDSRTPCFSLSLPLARTRRNLVVRTYFAVLKDTPSEQFVIKCVERGRTCSPAVLSELAIHHQSYGHPYIASLKDVFLYVSNGSNILDDDCPCRCHWPFLLDAHHHRPPSSSPVPNSTSASP